MFLTGIYDRHNGGKSWALTVINNSDLVRKGGILLVFPEGSKGLLSSNFLQKS